MHISPTQVATFRMCQRKWAWNKLNGIRRPSNKHAQLGTDTHDVLERWLRDATAINTNTRVGQIAMAGIQHLPEPKTGTTEHSFRFKWGGIIYVGKIDWYKAYAAAVCILDHKTTGNFSWAKKPEDLKTDEQAIIYGMFGLQDVPEADRVDNRWVYYRTKDAPKSRLVEITLSRDHIEAEFALIHETALEMVALAEAGKKALDLEPCVQACDAYGGCPYRNECNLSSSDRMKSLITQHTLKEKTMGLSLAEKMKQKQTEAAEKPEPEETAAAAPEPAKTNNKDKKSRGINPPKAAGAGATDAVATKLGNIDDQVIVLVMTPAQLKDMFR